MFTSGLSSLFRIIERMQSQILELEKKVKELEKSVDKLNQI